MSEEQREITRTIKQLELSIERLQAATAALESRISPILQDAHMSPETVPEGTTGSTELGRILQGFNNRLVDLDLRLREIEGRVEL